MSDLDEVARKFKAAQLKSQGAISQPVDEIDLDLDARIEARMAEVMQQPSPPEDSVVDVSDSGGGTVTPIVKPARQVRPVRAVDDVAWSVPAAANRALGRRDRVTVELPVSLEELRLAAKAKDMSCGHLVLSALELHGDRVLRDAADGRFEEVAPRGFTKKWQMMWHPDELVVFDRFVDEVSPLLPRRSRALVAELLLGYCAKR